MGMQSEEAQLRTAVNPQNAYSAHTPANPSAEINDFGRTSLVLIFLFTKNQELSKVRVLECRFRWGVFDSFCTPLR
jgi:hypothetical protein